MSSNIFFTSDTHYNHKNIVRGTTSWNFEPKDEAGIQQLRDFNSLEEHNQILVDRINYIVKTNDILYHLGDWSFGGINSIWDFRKQIRCNRVNLILGNHDAHIANNKNISTGGDVIFAAKTLFNSVSYYEELKINNAHLIMSHYSMRVWNKSHKGSIMLFGHSHGSLKNISSRTMDVGVDTNNYFPYSLDDILERMNKVEVKILDHHK